MVIKIMSNAKDTNFFTKKFTTCQCGKWLLVNEKIMLVGLDEKSIKSFSQQVNNNQKKML